MKVENDSNKIFGKVGKLVKLIDDLKESGCLYPEFSLNLPKIIFFGAPSSGKSSIIESILGIEIVPKGENQITTRRPIEIKLIHVPYTNIIKPYCEFLSEEGKEKILLDELKSIRQKIEECIEKKAPKSEKNDIVISKEPLKLNIYANNVPDLTIIDLPGVADNIRYSKDVAFNYMKDENSIILYVQNADGELFSEKSFTLKGFIEEVDKDFTRTLAVLTKLDLISTVGFSHQNSSNPLNVVRTLLEKQDPKESIFYHAFVGLKNRSCSDKVTSIQINLHKEREYFSTHPVYKLISSPDALTLDSLIEKIKKLQFDNPLVKKNIVAMHNSIKDKINDCQKELLKFGTDYIGYTNDTKNTYVTALINNFCETIERVFSGKIGDANENAHAQKLRESYYDFLRSYKTGYNPGSNFKNHDIIKIIEQTEGDGLSGFPQSEVISALLGDEMDKLREEIKAYLDSVNNLTRESIKIAMTRIFCRFPKLMDKMEDLMNFFIEENFDKMKYLVESVAEMNFNYLYIDESSLSYNKLLKKFVLIDEVKTAQTRDRSNTMTSNNSQSSFEKTERSLPKNDSETENDKDHYYKGLAEYVKILINYNYSIIVRNLRENVPKVTAFYFIRNLKHDLRFYLLNEISKEFSYEDFLVEDPDVEKTRNFYINLMKVLKNSEKVLQYDEEIKNVIKEERIKNIDRLNENNLKITKEPIVKEENSRVLKTDNKVKYEKRDSLKEEIKTHSKNESNSRMDHILKNNGNNPNLVNKNISSSTQNTKDAPNSQNTQTLQNTQNIKNSKSSMQSYLREEEPRKQSVQEDLSKQTVASKQDQGAFSIKMDQNSNDIKDMKVNVNMDAETAYKFYQTNKKYLPTGQQMMAGAKATANFVEKSANVIEEGSTVDRQETIVTGNKPQPKKGLFDPLTSLFGTSKKDTSKNPNNTSSSNNLANNKKGQF